MEFDYFVPSEQEFSCEILDPSVRHYGKTFQKTCLIDFPLCRFNKTTTSDGDLKGILVPRKAFLYFKTEMDMERKRTTFGQHE